MNRWNPHGRCAWSSPASRNMSFYLNYRFSSRSRPPRPQSHSLVVFRDFHESVWSTCLAIALTVVPNQSCSLPVARKPNRSYNRMADARKGVVLRIKRLYRFAEANFSARWSNSFPMPRPRIEGRTAILLMCSASPSGCADTVPTITFAWRATQTVQCFIRLSTSRFSGVVI
jgi:hypothetical protein